VTTTKGTYRGKP